jgi:hypothetical protein
MHAALFNQVIGAAPFALGKDFDVADVHEPGAGTGRKRRMISDHIPPRKAETRASSRAAKLAEGEPPRQLRPLDDATAHVPFPYDTNFLASLRSDQKPRYYGALTDRSKLPDKTFDLSSLVATQNRVDPGKVESMAQSGVVAATPPLVMRHNGRDYIADGHHRLAAEWLQGNDTAQAKFIDLTERTNALKALASATFEISKASKAKQQIFGWASVVTKGGLLIVDKQDDIILPGDLEVAVYDHVLHARDHGEMHTNIGTGRLIESMVFTEEKQKALDIDLGMEGWWAGWTIDCAKHWGRIESGELTELSIGGSAVHEEIDS